jgi:hypothetical protein
MRSNHQDEREREIQALKEHFKNESFWTRLKDSYRLCILCRALELNWVIAISFFVAFAVVWLLGFSNLNAWIAGAVVSFVAMCLHARLRPDD